VFWGVLGKTELYYMWPVADDTEYLPVGGYFLSSEEALLSLASF